MNITPQTKNILLIAMAALIVMLVVILIRDKPPFELRPPPPRHENKGEEIKIEGSVKEFGSNPMGDIDKILLQQNDTSLWLQFPPHTARQILNIAKKNEKIKLVIHEEMPGREDDMHGTIIVSITNTAEETFDLRKIPPPTPAPGKMVTVEGTNVQLNTDNQNHVMSMVLADKIIVLPRHVQQSLLPLLSSAHHITVEGYERNPEDGFVNKSGFNLVKPVAIIIDSVKYTIE